MDAVAPEIGLSPGAGESGGAGECATLGPLFDALRRHIHASTHAARLVRGPNSASVVYFFLCSKRDVSARIDCPTVGAAASHISYAIARSGCIWGQLKARSN